MGINIHASWGMTEDEKEQQHAAFLDPTAGAKGYLREAYHGEPYATVVLCKEAFKTGEAAIPAAVLRERLGKLSPPLSCART